MITQFEELLRIILTPALVDTDDPATMIPSPDIFFVPPDEKWRGFADDSPNQLLNVFLVDLCENRKLRTSAPGAPARLDCHYVISVWRKREDLMTPMPGISWTREESKVLYKVAACILASSPMVPARILGLDPADHDGWPEQFSRHEIPVRVATPEGFPKIPEFWGTFGSEQPWKPILHIIATLPIILPKIPEGPPITTIVSEYKNQGTDEQMETLMIGGLVNVDNQPTENVIVKLFYQNELSRTATTDQNGHFSMDGLIAGTYRLEAEIGTRNNGLDIEVPSPYGRYEVNINL